MGLNILQDIFLSPPGVVCTHVSLCILGQLNRLMDHLGREGCQHLRMTGDDLGQLHASGCVDAHQAFE